MKKTVLIVIRVVCIVGFLVCVGVLGWYWHSDRSDRAVAEALAAAHDAASAEAMEQVRAVAADNADTIGWLRIDGTNIKRAALRDADPRRVQQLDDREVALFDGIPGRRPVRERVQDAPHPVGRNNSRQRRPSLRALEAASRIRAPPRLVEPRREPSKRGRHSGDARGSLAALGLLPEQVAEHLEGQRFRVCNSGAFAEIEEEA